MSKRKQENMKNKKKIINIAVIAHVDAGKSTLVDALLGQSGVFRANEEIIDCVMDSDDIERERGITIYSKNCSIMHGDYKINIVDTPGHADFLSEVERIIKTVDTVVLLVDSSEGPMPQTRFVLQKSLQQGLNPILLINKIDKKDARPVEVVDMVYELFMDLHANDQQLDFPILYGIAKQGIAKRELDDGSTDLTTLFDTIISHVKPYPNLNKEPLPFQVSTLAYDDYIGRLGIGRITKGKIKTGQTVAVAKADGTIVQRKINQVFTYVGMKRTLVDLAESGDIVVVAGISDISIGETICDEKNVQPMEMIQIEEPTLSMNFMVNKSPFAGKVGKFVTSRHIRKGMMRQMSSENGYAKIEYLVPTRGLLGYRTEFINDTRGEGTMVRRFESFEPHKGDIPQRTNGVAIAIEDGISTPYALYNISERVQLFIESGTKVYEGMIVGMNSRNDDMVINPCKAKKVTNMRAAGTDDSVKLPPSRAFTLEEALEFIDDDELVEIVPNDIRLRKKELKELERRRSGR